MTTSSSRFRNVTKSIARSESLPYGGVLEYLPELILLANPDHDATIVYLNKAAREGFATLREEFRSVLGGADVGDALGGSAHRYHRNPSYQRSVLAKLKEARVAEHTTSLEVGPMTFSFTLIPLWKDQSRSELAYWMAVLRNVSSEHQVEYQAEVLTKTTRLLGEQVTTLASATEEMSITVSEITTSAHGATSHAEELTQRSEAARGSVEAVAHSTTVITSSMAEVKEIIEELERETQDIDATIATITGIAAKTNLLALNAAIEAARAGEAGRGFAVVAEEVRSLATLSAESAQTITERVRSIRRATATVSTSIASATAEVRHGEELVREAELSFTSMYEDINAIAGMISQIAQASDQQSFAAQELASSTLAVKDLAESSMTAIAEPTKVASKQASAATNRFRALDNESSSTLKAPATGHHL